MKEESGGWVKVADLLYTYLEDYMYLFNGLSQTGVFIHTIVYGTLCLRIKFTLENISGVNQLIDCDCKAIIFKGQYTGI